MNFTQREAVMKRILSLALALAPALLFVAPAAQGQQPGGTVLRDVEYATVGDVSLRLDLYLPSDGEGPFPVLVWIHGGGWMEGSKNLAPNSFQVRQTARGYAVASINYRLSQQAIFPAQIHDCKAAVRWLRAHAREYNLDPDRVASWGSSAGGHLATLLGTSGDVEDLEGSVGGNLEFSSRVQATVDMFGPSNFLTIGSQER